MIPGDYTLEIFRGRARTWRAQLFQDALATQPVILTGCTVAAAIQPPGGGAKIPLSAAVVEEEGITPEDGWVEFSITDENAALLTGTYYSWGATITDSLGDPNPCLSGPVLVAIDNSL